MDFSERVDPLEMAVRREKSYLVELLVDLADADKIVSQIEDLIDAKVALLLRDRDAPK